MISAMKSTALLSRHKAWIGVAGAMLVAFITALMTLSLNDFLSPDRWYYLVDDDQARSALVAKSLAEGLGYKTPLLPNAMIEYYHQAGQLNVSGLWENSDRFPMTIFGIFLLFKLFGSTSPFIGMAVFGAVFFVASAGLLYALANRLTGKPLVGLIAVALMCITHDTSDTIYYKGADDIFYSLLVFYSYIAWRKHIYSHVLWRPRNSRHIYWFILSLPGQFGSVSYCRDFARRRHWYGKRRFEI